MHAPPPAPVHPLTEGLRVVLFVDRDAPEAAATQARFEAVRWPQGTHTEVIDVATDLERARWYGIADVPAVAVVCDGALLAIEHSCDAGACRRVYEVAHQRDPRTLDWFRRRRAR